MVQVMNEKEVYLSAFEQFEKETSDGAPAVRRLRKAAIARFNELGFPGPRSEDWRFTNLAPLVKIPFQFGGPARPDAETLRSITLPDCAQLVFVNGRFVPDLSATTGLPGGVIAGSLADALKAHPDKVEPYLARFAKYDDHTFTALNTAFLRDGAFVCIPRGVVLDKPIHLLFVSNAAVEPTVAHPRNLVVAGVSSQVRLVETYAGPDGVYFTNAVTEIVAGENAVIDHYKLQREGRAAFHIAATQVHQSRSSNFSSHYIGLGGGLVRNEARVVLDGEGCECTLNGLYTADGSRHLDNFTVIDHAKPHCASHELYKGILDGKGRGVFNGKIFVRPDAQKTDAKQTNQTLLLSDDATINTKPQLEIYADDVKCTHGATVGNLNADALFYLRSRGIDEQAARALLTFAFANDIVGRIKVESLRQRLEESLLAAHHLPTDRPAKEAV